MNLKLYQEGWGCQSKKFETTALEKKKSTNIEKSCRRIIINYSRKKNENKGSACNRTRTLSTIKNANNKLGTHKKISEKNMQITDKLFFFKCQTNRQCITSK